MRHPSERYVEGEEAGPGGGPQPPLTRPPDFASFWEKTRAELGHVPLALSREPLESEDPALAFERLAFDSLGGARVSGYAIRWADDVSRPLVVHSHGYGGEFDPMWHWAKAGLNVVGVQVRGYGLSEGALPGSSPHGYILTGIESPEEHVLRGAVCDYVRMVEVGSEILGDLVSRTVLHGTSFAGGLALMAEAVAQTADFLVVAVPSFGWAEGRRFLVEKGSGQEVNRYLEAHPEREEDAMSVLSYFDSMNFAVDISCPALVGLGLEDNVVPAPTVYAIVNHLGGPHQIVRLPVSHTERPEEKLWERFEAYWIRLAEAGLPSGFGETRIVDIGDSPTGSTPAL